MMSPTVEEETGQRCLSRKTLDAIKRGAIDEQAEAQAFEHIDTCGLCCDAFYKQDDFSSTLTVIRVAAQDFTSLDHDPIVQKHSVKVFSYLGPKASGHPDDLGTFGQDGRYRVMRQTGAGGTADVFEAYDTRHCSIVALKVLRVGSDTADESKAKVAAEDRERFRQEARAGFALRKDNERMAYVLESDCDHDPPYIVVEYVSGVSLRQHLKATKKRWLKEKEAARILFQVAQGLARVHEQGWVHQDIKPENVLLSEEKGAKIIDAGSAFQIGGGRAASRSGTKEYSSPERAADRGVDKRSDVYSFGVMLYEMTVGSLPERCDRHFAEGKCPPKCNRSSSFARDLRKVPRGLRSICKKCLEHSAEARYQDGTALQGAIGRYLTWWRRVAYACNAALLVTLAAASVGGYVYYRQAAAEATKAEQELGAFRADIENLSTDLRKSLAEDDQASRAGGELKATSGGRQYRSERTRQVAQRLGVAIAEYAKRIRRGADDDVRLLNAKALIAQAQGDNAKVLAMLPEQVVRDHTNRALEDSAQAYQMNVIRGTSLMATKAVPEAVRNLRDALRIKPNDPYAAWLLGRCLRSLGRESEVWSVINPAIVLSDAATAPDDKAVSPDRWTAALYLERAICHGNASRWADAMTDVDRAIALNRQLRQQKKATAHLSGYAAAHAFRCVIALELQRPEETVNSAAAALIEYPLFPQNLVNNAVQMWRGVDLSLESALRQLSGPAADRAAMWLAYSKALISLHGLYSHDVDFAEEEISHAIKLVESHDDRHRSGVPCLVYVINYRIYLLRYELEVSKGQFDSEQAMAAYKQLTPIAERIVLSADADRIAPESKLIAALAAGLLIGTVKGDTKPGEEGATFDSTALPTGRSVEVLCMAIRGMGRLVSGKSENGVRETAREELRSAIELHGMIEAKPWEDWARERKLWK